MKIKVQLLSAGFVLFLAATIAGQHATHTAPETAAVAKPIELVSTDAIAHRKAGTSTKQAQAFFDQGLTFY